MRPVLLAGALAGSLVAQSPRPTGDSALLPPDGAVGAWKKAGNPRIYSRADLYGYIDGGAELFFEFGFEELTQQKYGDGSSQILVDFYRMTDAVAAHGVYLMKCGKENRLAAFGERHTINRYQLMFTRDRFFAILSHASGREIPPPEFVEIASSIATRLPPARPVSLLAQLPRAGLVEDSVRLVRGPVALQTIFTLGDGDILQLAGRITAVAGRYADPARGTWTQIEATYPTPAAASAAMAYLQGHLDPYLTVVSRMPGRLVFRDYENTFGVVSVSGSALSARLRLKDAPKQP